MSDSLNNLYTNTVLEYQKFFDKVHEAFSRHCEKIRTETNAKIDATAEEDAEARQKILDEQQKELDESWQELKRILDSKGRMEREKLEQIVKREDAEEFNIDKELANL